MVNVYSIPNRRIVKYYEDPLAQQRPQKRSANFYGTVVSTRSDSHGFDQPYLYSGLYWYGNQYE